MSNQRNGFVKLKKGDNVIYMPSLLTLHYKIFKLINDSIKTTEALNNEKDEDKRKQLSMLSQDLLIQSIDAMIEKYPEYAEFSEDFNMIDHIKIISSIGKGSASIEIKEMVEGDFLVEETHDERDIPNEDSESFLSQNQ